MRKLLFLAAAGLMATPLQSQALNLDKLTGDKTLLQGTKGKAAAEVYYDNGVHLDFGNRFTSRWNFLITPSYTYEDNDGDAGGVDNNDLDVQRARLEVGGTFLDGLFSFGISNDFDGDAEFLANGNDGNRDLRDAWLQWNPCEDAGLRFGQFVIDYGRQANAHLSRLQMIDRSITTQYFVPGRNTGAMWWGNLGGFRYSITGYEGESDGEGINFNNRTGVDPDMGVAAAASVDFGDYGPRDVEGDYYNTAGFAGTVGVAGTFEYGTNTYGTGPSAVTLDNELTRVSGDLGLRSGGFSLQSEVFYSHLDFDDTDADASNDWGYYVQTGFFVVPQELEIAGRYARIDFDAESVLGVFDNLDEFSLVLGYYVDGHNLKIQTGPTWENTEFRDGDVDDSTDFRYEVRVTGYL
jgi:hypothetical protein